MKKTPDSPSSSRWLLPVLACIALLHIGLAVSYARVTPYRTAGFVTRMPAQDIGAPDERQHANYVQHILDGKGIPVFNPADPNLYESYQAHQPPLYYLLATGFSKVAGLDDLTSASDGVVLRYLNALIGVATLLGIYFLCVWGFGRADLGVLAAGIVGLIPMFAALHGAISNDPLLFCLCTWALAVCGLGVRQGWTVKRCVVAGVLVGLGILTKTTAIALIPTLLLAFWMSEVRPSWKLVLAAALPAALLAVPWWARNLSVLEGFDPLAIKAFGAAFKGSPMADFFINGDPEQRIEGIGAVAYWKDMVGWFTVRSFIGVFGYMDLFLDKNTYRLILVVPVILIAAWILASQKPEWKEHRRVQIVNVVFLFLVIALFLRFNAQYFQGQARYLYPAIAVFGTGFGIGALFLSRNRMLIPLAVIGLGLLALNLYVLGWLPGEFARRMS